MPKRHQFFLTFAVFLALAAGWDSAQADEIKNPLAVFAGLDKITGRVIRFEVAINERVQFGTLQIRPRACYTKPPTEAPQTVSFVQVDNVSANNKLKRIFSGWMFAASPGLNGVEHPVYDVWLLDCKGGTKVTPSAHEAAAQPQPPAGTPIGESAGGAKGLNANPPAVAPLQGGARRSVAPPFRGPPIEVGEAPGEGPAAIAPPGPLPPALRPTRDRTQNPSPPRNPPDERDPY